MKNSSYNLTLLDIYEHWRRGVPIW